jgi:hypothetical protein
LERALNSLAPPYALNPYIENTSLHFSGVHQKMNVFEAIEKAEIRPQLQVV